MELDTQSTKTESKLPDWSNPPSIEDLKNDYSEASTFHYTHIKNVIEWDEVIKGTNDNFKPVAGRSDLKPKVARKLAEWRYASLEAPFLSDTDIFNVTPVTHLDVQSARQNELVLNKQFRVDIPRTSFINNYIRTAVNRGTIIVKIGWEYELGIVREEYDKPVNVDSMDEIVQFLKASIQNGMPIEQAEQLSISLQQELAMNGTVQITTEKAIREVEKPVINRPVLEIRDSREVVIDPTCEGDLANARFVIDTYVSDMSTLKQDGRYTNLDKIEVQSSGPIDAVEEYTAQSLRNASFSFKDTPRKKLQVFEYWGYWDIDGSGIVKPIVVTYVGNVIIRMEENPYPDKKLPFVLVKYIPSIDLKSIYGEPDAELLKDNQKVIGAVSRGILDLLGRSSNAQQGVATGFLDEENLANFKKGKDFMFNTGLGDIKNNYLMTSYPEIPQSALNVIQLHTNEAEALTGVRAFSQGLTGDSLGSSVGGMEKALDATAKRESGILYRLSQGLIDIGKKILSMNSVWLSDEEVVRITDDDFVTIKRDDLAGQYDLSVSISTAEEDNFKAQQLSFLLQTIGPNADFSVIKMLMIKFAQLYKMPDLIKALQEYEPQPDPLAQEKAQLEIELLKAQIANEQAKASENAVDVELKRAKTQTELSKASLNSSVSDNNNLKFVSEASGLTQDRELEKINFTKQNEKEKDLNNGKDN